MYQTAPPLVPPDAPAYSAAGPELSAAGPQTSSTSTSTTRSLRERRSGSRASLGLNMESITSSSRDKPSNTAQTQHFRGWSPTAAGRHRARFDGQLDMTTCDPNGIRVLSYNILAARYTSTEKYVQCPVFALSEPYRLANVMAEIRGANPDIAVLQEVSIAALDSPELGAALTAAGYAWFHVVITTDRRERATSNSGGTGDWTTGQRPEHEGVAIVYRVARFELAEQIPVRFNVLAGRDASLQPEEKRRVMVNSHNVAAIVVLQDKRTGMHLIVAGIHAFWDSAKPDCQTYQQIRLLEEVERISSVYEDLGDASVLYCGDMNAERPSPSITYVLEGSARNAQSATRGQSLFPATVPSAHSLRLASAYDEYVSRHVQGRPRGEAHVTTANDGYSGVIDHIFFQRAAFECVAVAKLAPVTDLPNCEAPSDHYPVCAWLVPASPTPP